MNGRGKSDSAIVAGKPTNKAGQPAAESVEPSAEAEGNASQQSTRRAQDRESVSQALERIRQVARQRKKERFTSLFHLNSRLICGVTRRLWPIEAGRDRACDRPPQGTSPHGPQPPRP